MTANDPSPSLVIIGAGAVGLYLSRKLASTYQITLLESGPLSGFVCHDPRNAVCTTGQYLHGQSGRARGLGGTTNLWGGQLLPFSPQDLTQENGWPFSWDDLQDHYEVVSRDLLGESSRYDNTAAISSGWSLPSFPDPALHVHISKWLANPRFKYTFASVLRSSVCLRCNLTVDGIEARSSGKRYRLHCVHSDGSTDVVETDCVIIATGTIESVRLLQCSKQYYGLTVSSAVGTGFMDHVSLDLCELIPRSRWKMQRFFNTRRVGGGHRYSVRISASSSWLSRSTHCLNVSAMVMVRQPASRLLRLINYLSAGLSSSLFGFIAKPFGALVLNLMVEQASDTCDKQISLGSNNLPFIDWSPHYSEAETVLAYGQCVIDSLMNSGWLRVRPPLPTPSRVLQNLEDVCHPMGGAAMHVQPKRQVVTDHLEVIGSPNLYVCSAAVFPSGSHSNPTMTLLALADRLSSHLMSDPQSHF